MNFNEHSNLQGEHAFLSPSNYHWLNYSPEHLQDVYLNLQAKEKGTILHAFACDCIKLNQRLPRTKATLNMYVNDSIGFKMRPEQVLYYSDNCYGTADAISFRQNLLRIHDLKTGVTPASMVQLEVYMALFCLEYDHSPEDIQSELHIYQSGEVLVYSPTSDEIRRIMDTIISFDKILNEVKVEEE